MNPVRRVLYQNNTEGQRRLTAGQEEGGSVQLLVRATTVH